MTLNETQDIDLERISETSSVSNRPCPYRELFKSAVILMPQNIRQEFLESWEETDLEEFVFDMIEEVEEWEAEREENQTREPESSSEEFETESEPETNHPPPNNP